MFQRLHRSLDSPINSILINGGSRRPTSFGTRNGVLVSTLITSRKCYPKGLTALSTITVIGGEGTLTDVEYSLDGINWTAVAGVWGTSKFIIVRGISSAVYSDTLSANIELASDNYLFFVTTEADPVSAGLWQDGDTMLTQDGEELII